MKKILSVVAALTILLTILPLGAVSVSANEYDDHGTTGDCTWTLVDGHLTISGNGAMEDYDDRWNSSPWVYGPDITSITIEEGVTSIGAYSFVECNDLISVSIPSTITTIGDAAFGWSCLTEITLSENVNYIGDYAFAHCDLTEVALPEGVTYVGGYAFCGCPLTEIVFPNSVSYIGGYAFGECDLTEVTLPANVSFVGSCAFCCPDITAINVAENNPYYSSRDGVLYNKAQTTIVACPSGREETLDVPYGVTTIEDRAFYECCDLPEVVLPDTVTHIGNYAFYDCTNLYMVLPYGVTYIGSAAFQFCHSITEIIIPETVTYIGTGAFAKCSDLLSVQIDANITSIEWGTFVGCYSLESVTIPGSVTYIGGTAFDECYRLFDIWFENSSIKGITVDSWNTYFYWADWHYGYCAAAVKHKYSNTKDASCDKCGYRRYAAITTQPTGTQVKSGETAEVTVGATGDSLTYTWYIKNKGAKSYSKSSIKTNTYSVKMSSTSRDRSVYCVVKDKKGNTVKSNAVVLRMAATITKQPTTAFAKRNATAKVTLTAAGDGLTYRWYVKNPGATEYMVSSVKSATYSAKMTEQNSGRLVYCVVTDKYGHTAQTNTVVMRMQASIISQPKTVTATKNTTARVQINAVGDGLTYTWYLKNSGAKSFSKSSITTNTYSVKMTSATNGRQLYCVVKDKYGKSVKSGTVTLKYETNYIYTINNGEATITGYKGEGGAISIPSALGGYPVTTIGDSAFFDCGNLTTVTIPAGVTAIDVSAFLWSNVSKFVVSADNPIYSSFDGALLNKEQTELLLIPESKTGSYTVPDGVVRITGSAGCYSSISTLIIPDSVQVIEGGAFGMSTMLKKVIIGNGVTTIGDQAFVYCSELTSLTLGCNVATIGYAAFHETGLTTLALPKSIVSIGDSNFPYNSFSDIYYEGSSSEFENISIGEGNDSLLCAPRQYDCLFVSLISQSGDAYAAIGAKATATIEADGDSLTYTWYFKNKGAKSYTKSSVKTATYSTVMSSSSRDRSVYCVVKDAYGNETRSNTVVLHMTASITTQPKSIKVKNGTTAKVSIKASGDGLTYTWYLKDKGASAYTKSSVKTATYSVKMSNSINGRQLYCVIKDKYGNTVKSSTVTLKKK